MVTKFFLGTGLVLLVATAYFLVIDVPPTVQAPPSASEFVRAREEGFFPEEIPEENEEVEHDVFGVPEMDEMMLAQARANMDMSGMDMSGGDGGMEGMDMSSGGDSAMEGMDMSGGEAAPETEVAAGGNAMEGMDMSGGEAAAGDNAMAGMDMSGGDGEGTMQMAQNDSPSQPMEMAASDGDEAKASADDEEGETPPQGGLGFSDGDGSFDREIDLAMMEWGFSDMSIDVKKGERIKFNVRNDGTILHEFMFMTMPLMQAVEYRSRRADWNLLEHEALFEQSLVLPGQTVSFVVEVQESGSWMYMCMLPYHMEMGMMGQMATPGAAMQM